MFNRLKFRRYLFAKFVYIFRLAPVFWRQNDDFLSIDDADVSVLDALKVFEKHEIPFVLYVPTGLILEDHSRNQLLSIIFQKFYELIESLKLPNGEKATFGNIINYASQ
jgi:hypothetical protein|tara:strand:+ start:103 stop:429 length:327 start_codon:yes stop_codon:yes gene_type:complete